MAIRLQKKSESLLERMGTPVVDSVHDVWLAGLGAFVMARKESARMMDEGSKLFDKLVTEGEKFEKRALKMAKSEANEAADEISRVTEEARKRAKTATRAFRKPAEPVAYHLVPKGDGWTIHIEGSQTDIRRFDTKNSALDAARDLANAHMPSRLVVHRADGTIQTSHSYE